MQTFLPGHDVCLLANGTEYFPAIIAAIQEARQSIYLETYIFAHDPAGRAVTEALLAARARGIEVRVLVDAYGTRPYATEVLGQRLRAAGAVFEYYRKAAFPFLLRRTRLRRLHRKLLIVDGRVAFVGGINIIDDHNTPGHTPPRIDFAVRFEGPVLKTVCETVNRLWRIQRLASLPRQLPEDWQLTPQAEPVGPTRAKFVVRDNFRYRRSIERAYLAALRVAREEAVIANAYFLPGWRFRRALLDAAARGVRVRLLLQGRVEFWLLHHASRALYGQLLAGGVEIIEYEKSFLHAKVAVVDQEWATVGSSNIDPLSLLLAREANLVVRDRSFSQQLKAALDRLAREGGRAVRLEDWQARPSMARALEWLAYGLVRSIMGLFGVRYPKG